jgi:hypothetical protein
MDAPIHRSRRLIVPASEHVPALAARDVLYFIGSLAGN